MKQFLLPIFLFSVFLAGCTSTNDRQVQLLQQQNTLLQQEIQQQKEQAASQSNTTTNDTYIPTTTTTDSYTPPTTSNNTYIPPPATNYNTSSSCCKVCHTGKACGNSCISRSYTCHKGPGCACDG